MESEKVFNAARGIGAILGGNRTRSEYAKRIREKRAIEEKAKAEDSKRQKDYQASFRNTLITEAIATLKDPRSTPQAKQAAANVMNAAQSGAMAQPGQVPLAQMFGRTPEAEKPQRPIVTRPGDIVIDSSGKVTYENPNKGRLEDGGYWGQRKRRLEESVEAELKAIEKAEPTISRNIQLALKRIEKKQIDGIYGLGEAGRRRQQIEKWSKAAKKTDDAFKRVNAILKKNPESLTVAAGTAKLIQDFSSNLTGLINIIPGVNPSSLELDQNQWTDKLKDVAGDNAELQTIIFNIALSSAIADGFENQRLSDQQIEQAIEQVGGGNLRSPQSLARKLKETRDRVLDNLNIALEFQAGNYESMNSIGEQNPSQNSVIEEIRRRESGGK